MKLPPVVAAAALQRDRETKQKGRSEAQRGAAVRGAATGRGRAGPTDVDQEKAGFLPVFKAREKLLRTEE